MEYQPVAIVDGKKQKPAIAKAESVESSQDGFDCKNVQSKAADSYEWASVSADSIDEGLCKIACGK